MGFPAIKADSSVFALLEVAERQFVRLPERTEARNSQSRSPVSFAV